MFKQANFYLLSLVGLCVFLMIGTIGCGEDDDNPGDSPDDNPWVGTWSLETVDGNNIQAQFEAIELLIEAFGEDGVDIDISYTDEWTFDDDGTWDRDVTIVLPNDDNVAETTSFEVVGTYTLSDSNFTLTPESFTVKVDGEKISPELDAETETDVTPEPETTFGYVDTDTGLWLIEGNTLTLTSDDGDVLEFKKK